MPRSDYITLGCAFAASVFIHVIVLPITYNKKPLTTNLPPTKATHLKTPILEQEEIELGINYSKESTLTWIGYEEYEEQRARHSIVEQAEMRLSGNLNQKNNPQQAIDVLRNIAQPIATIAKDFLDVLEGLKIMPIPRKVIVNSTEAAEIYPNIEEPKPIKSKITEEGIINQNHADRDSEATSIIEISPDQWKSGKPLASQGIVLRPRRPSFTANQLVTNAPSDLVAEIYFNSQGKPDEVIVLYSTGSYSVDKSLESSLYRWRASGEQIDALKLDNTFAITIHITFGK